MQCVKHWIAKVLKSNPNEYSPGCWCCNELNDRLNKKKLIIIRVGHIIIPLRPLRPDIKRTLARHDQLGKIRFMFECSILNFEFYISVFTCIKLYLFKKCCLTVILNRYERANLLHEEFQFGDMHAKIVDDFHFMLRYFLEFSSNDSADDR